MNRFEKVVALVAGPIVGAGAAFYTWSASYAAASYLMLKSSTMWKSFVGGDVLMPARQAWYYLGNPIVTKLIFTATMLMLALSAVVAVGITLAIKRPWQVRPPTDGSRFATLKDLESAGLLGGTPGKSVLLGTFGKGRSAVDVRYSGDSHFFVNGPSRSGKGRSFVMPNLLEYEGSVIVLDVKLENYTLTGAARMAMGQPCYVFAPGSALSHRWNPLDFVRAWPERSTDLINLAATLLPIGEKEEAYWKQTARGLLAGALGYVLESATIEGRRNLRSVLRLLSTGRPFSAVLQEIIDNEPELDQFILGSFRQHLGRDEEQRPSFEGHVTTALAAFNNLLIAEACSASDFDIRNLRRKPFSLFIAAPVSDFGTVEPIIRLLIQQIHDVMLRSLPGADEPHKILMMLDEFYQFERLPEIIKRAPLVAGYGLTIALVAQNIPQIDERYGQQTRNALLGNMDVKLSIAVGDDATAKIVSDNLGRKYVEREGWGRHRGLLFGKQASSGRFELMPLMDPGSVQRLDDDNTILQVRSGYGAILNKLNFYSDARFIARRREVEGRKSELVVPEIRTRTEWPLFTPQPSELVVELPSVQAGDRQPNAIDHEMIVLEHAGAVFVEPVLLMHVYRSAIAAIDDQPTADLLFRLRTAPGTIGAVKGEKSRFGRQNRRVREQAMALVWPLRNAISQARWAVIAERLSDRAEGEGLSFTPGVKSSLTEHLDADEDETNQLNLGFSSAQETVDEVAGVARFEIGNEQVNDPNALTVALGNLRAALEQSMTEFEEENRLLVSS
ncbi:type IV secretory system conjugative DNA transfer family protein [Agrobacterium rhizogenes]|uniref:type IV secretory system conjugative DNA transfer family protein n=1 Tax=Rhizobium rhizogenes TaxID=359 RepID=UPI00115C8EA7|nr:type IV secretory system conjugative DNA transfer family protein [Rhizobium rhizogenes]NTG25107.1 type IV secretory system conjugative DNA transfer family protein [Rhizobium rhizogenes]NTG38903.1 type IV secretory system conjugative DNA transfer family protein [Rhizobium rhizogenes]NTG58036.1 type IV secretory system conjugative DNA transfer family protein [Rhizobium rhizogenes]NTH03603.1 type IV secretory system conjugative DNA transfer family protein [Rhizobium rhizogenes]NTH42810.1 type 